MNVFMTTAVLRVDNLYLELLAEILGVESIHKCGSSSIPNRASSPPTKKAIFWSFQTKMLSQCRPRVVLTE